MNKTLVLNKAKLSAETKLEVDIFSKCSSCFQRWHSKLHLLQLSLSWSSWLWLFEFPVTGLFFSWEKILEAKKDTVVEFELFSPHTWLCMNLINPGKFIPAYQEEHFMSYWILILIRSLLFLLLLIVLHLHKIFVRPDLWDWGKSTRTIKFAWYFPWHESHTFICQFNVLYRYSRGYQEAQ